MPVDDENDDSGDYSPPQKQKGTKRTRDSADYNGDPLVAVAPDSKVPRRSSRRSAAVTTPAPTPSASNSRVIQAPRRSTGKKTASASASGGSVQQQQSAPQQNQAAPPPDSNATNGHNPQQQQPQQPPQQQQADATAGSSSIPRPGSLAFNPYYSYLGPAAPMPPGGYNPYAMYMPMPPGMPYMPPPNFAPPPQQQQRPNPEAPRPAKPKRLKAHTVTSKSYSIPMVPRDKKGKPMLPLNVGIMTVINLGDVCMREHFHTERYIFPVGYEVTRRYLSTIDRTAEVVYHCTILDGGDGPKFQIIPSDVPDRPVIAGTATGAWSTIVKTANGIRQRQHSNSVSGPDFFGLGQNTIKHLIQELPNADRLRDYVWQHFVEGGPLGGRHAAVIPALPEEYDSHMLPGPYYPPRARVPTREEGEGPRQSHYPPHILAQAAQQQQQAQASGSGTKRTPTPQQQQPEYGGAGGESGRQVMPPAHEQHANYYLPHTHSQPGADASAPGGPSGTPYSPDAGYPQSNGGGPSYAPANGGYSPTGGPSYAPTSNGNGAGNNSFASIMNAFPTQEVGGANGSGVPEGGPPS
ncbi:hypothetical protein C8R46DRAFT_905950 [Mycena filopes]|nr:hypothetical protein C8R46DRAFT_905950 [Mycena filopes]